MARWRYSDSRGYLLNKGGHDTDASGLTAGSYHFIAALFQSTNCHRVITPRFCSARPNWALNRTYCGGPAFGLQKPSPNTSPPQ